MYRINEMPLRIPYENQVPGVIMRQILACIGFVGAILVLLSLRNVKLTPHMKMVLSLTCADLYFITSDIIYNSINLAGGGWVAGQVGCIVNAMVITGSCFCSVLTLLAVTMERYVTVIYSKELSHTKTHRIIAGIWVVSHIIVLIPIFSWTWGTAYGLQSGYILCTISWWDWSPAPIVMETLALSTLMGCLSMMIYGYTRIVLKYLEATKKLSSQKSSQKTGTTSVTPSAQELKQKFYSESSTTYAQQSTVVQGAEPSEGPKKRFSQAEKKLLIKAIILTCNFFFGWTPYLFKIIVEIATQKPIPAGWDIVCCIFAILNSTLNSYLMIFLDPKIKRNVMILLGLANDQ
jgi:hypothetical protein